MSNRKWNKGKPPFDGWWNVKTDEWDEVGEFWSFYCHGVWHSIVCEGDNFRRWAMQKTSFDQGDFEWCDYWPENARVPRINPNKEK